MISAGLVVAVALSMTVYAVFQHLLYPQLTLSELFFHHLWHVVVLSVVIYLFCWIAVEWLLVRPIHHIYLHLYEARKGKRKPLVLHTRVYELQTIVEGINFVLLHQSSPPPTEAEQ